MKRRGPKDDTVDYTHRTLIQARLGRDYFGSDVRGMLGVIPLALLVTGIGVLLMWLVL
jgi:hypothetical protein